MTVNGFKNISAACPSLKEVVINDMPTLSDACVLVSVVISNVPFHTGLASVVHNVKWRK